MKKIRWYQYFAIGAYVSGWLAREKSSVITKAEQVELAEGLLKMIADMIGEDIKV